MIKIFVSYLFRSDKSSAFGGTGKSGTQQKHYALLERYHLIIFRSN